MKKYFRLLIFTVLIIIFNFITAFAGNGISVMEVQDKGDNPVIFVKGYNGDVESATSLIGNTECSKVSFQKISDGKINLDTLILFDNSLSIPDDSREAAKEWVADFIADRKPYERFSIATYGEELEGLIDFTDEYSELKKVIDNIEYKDRDTYLTDVLYDLVNSDSFKENEEGAYRRILVISDGVDNKNVGYTTDELLSLLNESGIPVYTIGVNNKKKTNGDELSNMYSISRATNAIAATYGTDEIETLWNSLKEDRDIIRFEISPEDDVKDGSEKTVTLKFGGAKLEETVTADNVRMAQIVAAKDESEEQIREPEVEEPEDELEAEEPEEEEEPEELSFIEQYRTYILIGAIACFVIAILLIVMIVVLVSKRKRKENEIIETEDPFADMEIESRTEMVFDIPVNNEDDGSTVYIFDSGRNYTITLTDVSSPARMYQKPINQKLIIGRSASKSDIVIDYDQSISSKHCMIERRGDKFYLVDLQSSNGTFLNDSRVLSEVEIYSGSIIKMGRVQMKIEMS